MPSFARYLLLIPLAGAASLAALPAINSAYLPNYSPNAAPLARFSAQDCLSCHHDQQQRKLNHPLGVSGGPLGVVDCLSCHSSDSTDPQHTRRLSTRPNPMLTASPRQLCQSCHDLDKADPASALGHALAMGQAHLSPNPAHEPLGAGLDRESRECLSCHDGSAASTSGVREHGNRAWAGVSAATRIRGMHPIGVRYDASTKPNLAPQYQPVSRLPETVRLFNDKLGCGSCHTTYGKEEMMLAADPKKGRLCLSCHIK